MESERELHLLKHNEQLKRRINEIQELANAQDDDFRERLEELTEQKKALTLKNTALESRIFSISEECAHLKEMVEKLTAEKDVQQQPIEPQSNPLSESFVAEVHGLQDTVAVLEDDKKKLEAKIVEMEEDMIEIIQKAEELESTNTKLTEAFTSVSVEKKNLTRENKLLAEGVTALQAQLETLAAPNVDPKERGNSLFSEIEAKRQSLLKKKAEMEQEVAVLRRTLSSRGEEERRMAKEMDCMRESMKNLSDKNKSLLNELEKRKDTEAESVAIKSAASSIEKENELLKNEVARLKKQFVAAESRADENAHILSKATTSRSEFYKHIQEQADLTNVQSTPRPTMRQRTPSFSSHEQDDLTNVPSTPRPIMRQRTQSLTRSRREHTERKPSPIRAPVHTPIAGIRPTSSNEDTISRKRGIMIDFSEPGNRKKLEFKLHKLADNNQRRQLDHLKSHYDPDAGVYDQTYGETPAKAAKLVTPKKENKILDSILRKK